MTPSHVCSPVFALHSGFLAPRDGAASWPSLNAISCVANINSSAGAMGYTHDTLSSLSPAGSPQAQQTMAMASMLLARQQQQAVQLQQAAAQLHAQHMQQGLADSTMLGDSLFAGNGGGKGATAWAVNPSNGTAALLASLQAGAEASPNALLTTQADQLSASLYVKNLPGDADELML
jgi:hypothetical protein